MALRFLVGAPAEVTAFRPAGAGERRDVLFLIPPDAACYLFSGAALTAKNPRIIWAEWSGTVAALPNHVFLRTAAGVYLTRFRSLAEARRCLDPTRFFAAHESLLINLERLTMIQATVSKANQVGVAVDRNCIEWLGISRRSFSLLRRRLGMLRQRRRVEGVANRLRS